MFSKDAYAMEAFRPEDVQLFACPYTPSDDEATDIANALAALGEYFLLLGAATVPNWDSAYNGGVKETTVTTGITSIAYGDGATDHPSAGSSYTERSGMDDVVITLADEWEVSATARKIPPIVEYNNVVVPWTHFRHVGTGKAAGDLVLILDAGTYGYDTTVGKYKVTLWRPIFGATNIDMGGIPLAVTTQQHGVIGVSEKVFSRTTNDGGSGSGSFTQVMNYGKIAVASGIGAAAEVLNNPGEDLEKLLLGDSWTAGSRNQLTYRGDGKSLVFCLAKFNNAIPSLSGGAGDVGKLFCHLTLMTQAKITQWGAPQNIGEGSNELITRQVDVEWVRCYEHSILCS